MTLKIKIIVTFCFFTACNQASKQKVSSKSLNDSVLILTKNYKDTSQYLQAIKLLKHAINIDTNLFDTYSKKLFLEESLGQFENASETSIQMIRLKPDSAELYLKTGIYKDLAGDTLKAKDYYNRSLPRYQILIDTLQKSHPDRHNILNMIAINIIMLGQKKMLHNFLKENCKTKLDSVFMSADILGKTRAEILTAARRKYSR